MVAILAGCSIAAALLILSVALDVTPWIPRLLSGGSDCPLPVPDEPQPGGPVEGVLVTVSTAIEPGQRCLPSSPVVGGEVVAVPLADEATLDRLAGDQPAAVLFDLFVAGEADLEALDLARGAVNGQGRFQLQVAMDRYAVCFVRDSAVVGACDLADLAPGSAVRLVLSEGLLSVEHDT